MVSTVSIATAPVDVVKNNGMDVDGSYKYACDCHACKEKNDGFMDGSTKASFFMPAFGQYDWTKFGNGVVYAQ